MHIRKTRLLTPGPTPLYPPALHAMMGSDIHHRTEDFRNIYRAALSDLQGLMGTSNDVLILVASGSGAMESAVSNLFSRGDKVLVCSAGKFGERWVEMAKAFGLDAVVLKAEYGQAVRPEQVAGVLAHEVGHVLKRHSEAQLVRATGLPILLSVMTGGGGDTISTVASVATMLSYTREAEAEADDAGLALLERSAIDPMGLKEFFEIILAEEGKPSTGAWRKISSAIATHPGTEDRIKKSQPLPDNIAARPVMTGDQWQALKKICS